MNKCNRGRGVAALFRFFPVYLIGYILVERVYTPASYHISHCALDDIIPFCEYFVIPYFLWHIIIAAVCFYTFKHDQNRFIKLIRFFIACSVICFTIFIVFPNCQMLRPEVFPRDNIFTDIVRLIYFIDTNTNVCPSMHVIGCVGLVLTCWDMKKLNNLPCHILQLLIFSAICLSTVFLKQHSFVDVIVAIPVSVIGWWMSYGDEDKFRKSEIKKMLGLIFEKGKIFTIPNIMSLFRICLIPVMISVYRRSGNPYIVTALVALSGLTDILDGMIARKFNMVSQLGKILDPIADKLTQLALIYVLTKEYPVLWNLILIIAVKECVQGIFGYLMLQRNMTVHSSQWFGKLSTVLLYSMAMVLILFRAVSSEFVNIAAGICAAALLLALVMYTRFYLRELYPHTMYKVRDIILRGSGLILWIAAVVAVLLNADKLTAERIAMMAPENALFAAFVMILLFAAKSLTVVFSSAVLYAASAIIFDPMMALVVNFAGILIMSFIPYTIGRLGGSAELDRMLAKHKRLAVMRARKIENEFLYVLLIRVNALINYDIGSVYMGAENTDASLYYLGSICGMTPYMILYTLAGAGFARGNYVMAAAALIVKLLLTIVSIIVFKERQQSAR